MLKRGPEEQARHVRAAEVTDAIRDGARLAALRDLGILDSGPDVAIDRLTRLATRLLGVDVSLVSLLDEDRQFFLSQQGLQGEFARARQTPLSHSFCKYAVTTEQPFVVDDARSNSLVSDNLAIRDLGVAAYAGIPLVLEDGNAIGAFCVIDTEPRHWSKDDLAVLTDLAESAGEILRLRARLAQMGLRDRLTGLPNRTLAVSYCEELLAAPQEHGTVAVLCAGVNGFNQINQAFGTANADGVLQAIAERLNATTRPEDLLARLRGDVFVLVARDIEDDAQALAEATTLREAIAGKPLDVGDTTVTADVTVGIAVHRPGGNGPDLISEAANAMRRAKHGLASVHLAEEGWSAQAVAQLKMRDALTGALSRDEIRIVYQPIVDLTSGEVVKVESLARWENPELGPVSPATFIPLAEMSADIIPIGEWMLGQALAQTARWHANGHRDLGVTVNVSPLQLEQANFAEVVEAALAEAGVEGSSLGLEITEGVLLETATVQQRNLLRLRALGVHIVLDDFGTGYSALSYLRQFPIDVIKIDRAFVQDMAGERTADALVRAILAMGQGLEAAVVAEGIETEDQAALLTSLGCPLGQGFLYSRPVPSDDVPLGRIAPFDATTS